MRKTAFKKIEIIPYHFKFFKSCLRQIVIGPFLNTLPHMQIHLKTVNMYHTGHMVNQPVNVSNQILSQQNLQQQINLATLQQQQVLAQKIANAKAVSLNQGINLKQTMQVSTQGNQVTNQLLTGTRNPVVIGQQGTTIQQKQPFSVSAAQQGQLQSQLAMNIMNATNPVSTAATLALVRTFY